MVKKFLALFISEQTILVLHQRKVTLLFFWQKKIVAGSYFFFLGQWKTFLIFFFNKRIIPSSRNPQIIVSLTSIPPRFFYLPLVIKSIFLQSLPPDRIVLWLSESHKNKEFSSCSLASLPRNLKKLQKKGLEIYFTKDLGPYRKLLPSIKKFPNDIILTIDDDIFYEQDTIASLYQTYLQNSAHFVYCRRSRFVEKTSKKQAIRYKANELNFSSKNNHRKLFLTAGAGTLFPPKIFSQEIFNEKVFSKLAPYEDDSWYNVMLLLCKKSILQVDSKEIFCLPSSNWCDLKTTTKAKNRKIFNKQFSNIMEYYGISL